VRARLPARRQDGLHATEGPAATSMVCHTEQHDCNDLKPGTNSQSATHCTMGQDLIDLVSNVKYQSVVKNDWFGLVGLFLVYCHSCKRNFAWSMLDDAETKDDQDFEDKIRKMTKILRTRF